jgi:hypothetical protein
MTMLLPSYEQCRAALEAHQRREHAAACERRAAANRPWTPDETDNETLARELSDYNIPGDFFEVRAFRANGVDEVYNFNLRKNAELEFDHWRKKSDILSVIIHRVYYGADLVEHHETIATWKRD